MTSNNLKCMYKFIALMTVALLSTNNSSADDYEDEVRKRLGLKPQVQQVSAETNSELESSSEGRSGELVYNQGCAACHTAGLAGAPMLGSQVQWEERLDKGLELLTGNAYNGYNAMPAKGMCMDCSETEIERSVQYMLDALTLAE